VYPLHDYFPEAGDESSLKPQNSLMHRRDRDVLAQRLSSEGPQDVEIVTSDGSYYINIGFGSPCVPLNIRKINGAQIVFLPDHKRYWHRLILGLATLSSSPTCVPTAHLYMTPPNRPHRLTHQHF
jgi:hypothetical protein